MIGSKIIYIFFNIDFGILEFLFVHTEHIKFISYRSVVIFQCVSCIKYLLKEYSIF